MLWQITFKWSMSTAQACVMLNRQCTESGGIHELSHRSCAMQQNLDGPLQTTLQAANTNLNCKARKACQTGWLNTQLKLYACNMAIVDK